ncbi:MAG: tetratricopeptide repeat protein, partial [Myxococcota bacterium]|nr:tetratricopeptide repeat protein [Myxococcota bacterium]
AHYAAERYEDALECFRSAIESRHGIGYRPGEVVNLHNIGDVYFRIGEYSRAWASFSRSRDLASEMGWQGGVTMNDIFITYLDGTRYRDSESIERMRRVVNPADGSVEPDVHLTARWLLGRLLVELGETEEGRAVLEQALYDARELQDGIRNKDIRMALEGMA